MYVENLEHHQAFWKRRKTARPLFGINVGFMANQRFPLLMESLPSGEVKPEDIRLDLFLKDCDRLYELQQDTGDYPYVAAAFPGLPWLEAIMGCPIASSPTNLWAEPCVSDWREYSRQKPNRDNPWYKKLIELVQGLIDHSGGRFQVAATLMRGPADMLSAMRGASNFVMDLIDNGDVASRAARLCADVWKDVGRAQLELIPDSDRGYVAGDHALRTWAPDKVIWLQEDAMGLLSPQLYRGFFLELDRYIAAGFPCVAFHLHGSALWAIDDLVKAPEIDVVELNLEDANCDVEGTCAGWKKIQANKPLVIWRMYKDDFPGWLERVIAEIPANGLSVQVSTATPAEAGVVKAIFLSQMRHLIA